MRCHDWVDSLPASPHRPSPDPFLVEHEGELLDPPTSAWRTCAGGATNEGVLAYSQLDASV